MFDLISIGDSAVDTLVQIHEASVHCSLNREDCQLCIRYADKILADDVHIQPGGNAMNVAIGASRLGLNTAIYTTVGADTNGKIIIDTFSKDKVNKRYVTSDHKRKTNTSVIINFQSERTILAYHEKFHYKLPQLAKTKWFYITSMGQNWQPFYNNFVRHLRLKKSLAAFNPGTLQLKAGAKKLKPILQKTTALFLNKEEARLLTHIHEEQNVSELLKGMRRLGAAIAVLTDGPRGAYAFDGERCYHIGSFKSKAIERTGAGDSFATAFVAALAYKHNIAEALRWGSINAASVISKFGAEQGLLSLKRLREIAESSSKFKARLI